MSELYDIPKFKDLIYDIGMHKGEDTEFYLLKGFRVVAFEADPDLACFCKNRFKKFIDQGRLTVIEGAIVSADSPKPGRKVVFYRNDKDSVWGTVSTQWAQRNLRLGASSSAIEVEAVDFVGVMKRYGVPHYMKIDIEGLDMVCVNALRLFHMRPDYISIESDKASFNSIKCEISAFVQLGYDCFQAVEQSAIIDSQTPPNPAREGDYAAHRFERGSSGLFGSELDGNWKSKSGILRQYRLVQIGYYLLGDDGIMNKWKFRGARRLRSLISRFLEIFAKADVPGWYDTHARHSSWTDKR
jgi:FkbM family methyltransferase